VREVVRMKILPTAMRMARWMAYLGLVCGLLYSVGGLVYDALVGIPLVFGVLGFCLGALGALMAGSVGAALDRK